MVSSLSSSVLAQSRGGYNAGWPGVASVVVLVVVWLFWRVFFGESSEEDCFTGGVASVVVLLVVCVFFSESSEEDCFAGGRVFRGVVWGNDVKEGPVCVVEPGGVIKTEDDGCWDLGAGSFGATSRGSLPFCVCLTGFICIWLFWCSRYLCAKGLSMIRAGKFQKAAKKDRTEHVLECGSKRGLYMCSDEVLHKALSFKCRSCSPECGEKWQRKLLAAARWHFHRLTLQEQMMEVYTVLQAAYNVETKEISLSIQGTVM